MTVGLLLAFAAPVADLAGLPPIPAFDRPVVGIVGLVLVVLGIAETLLSQWVMGDSWRGDVHPDARTDLVTTGPFRLIRNPVLMSTATTGIGIALLVPNVVAALMVVLFIVAQQIQVRLVEEPYLLRIHGDAYRDYASRTGRFIPWVGRLPRRDR